MVDRDMLEQAARRFKLLGDPTRLELLSELHEEGEMTVQALVEATGQRHANVSKHLQRMLGEGFVARRQEGRCAYYAIADPTLAALCTIICSRLREEAAAGSHASQA